MIFYNWKLGHYKGRYTGHGERMGHWMSPGRFGQYYFWPMHIVYVVRVKQSQNMEGYIQKAVWRIFGKFELLGLLQNASTPDCWLEATMPTKFALFSMKIYMNKKQLDVHHERSVRLVEVGWETN